MTKEKQKLQNGTPRFQQIIEYIRQKIRSGELSDHAALPTEKAIGELFDVSRMTARRALMAVETEGLAYSRGRKGRFVSPKRLTYDIGSVVSFSAAAKAARVGLTIRLIESGIIRADSDLAVALSVEEGAYLYKFIRLFLVDDHPAFIEVEYLIADLFPGLLEHDLLQSTVMLIDRHYNISAHTGEIMVRMRSIQADEAKLLGLTTYQAGIELEQITYDQDGRPYCYDRQIWRGELVEFSALAVMRDAKK